MGGKWREVSLGEIYEYRSGLSKPRSAFGSGFGFLSFKDVFYNFFVPETLTELVNSTERERELCDVRRGDVFLTRTSETMHELGMSCVALRDHESAAFNGFCKRLRAKPGTEVHPEYAAYYFRSPRFRRAVTAMSSLSTRASLNSDMLDRLTILLPPIRVQVAIGSILKALDDKIELNRRMNETLEAMARALFKSWFVDFDPVRAKAQGQTPPGMDPATAALFPSELEDSELGEIPKGWKHVPVRDVCDGLFDGPHATPPEADSGAVFLGIKNFTPTSLNFSTIRYISEEDWPRWTKRVEPRHQDIVFTYEATLGFFALIPPNLRCCLGRRTALVRPRAGAGDSHFLFHWFTARPFQEFLFAHRQPGSTVDRIWLKDFPNYPVLQPPRECVVAFEATVSQLWSRIHANQAEARTLADIRDALLPRLLSGELSVVEADKAVEATA